MHSPAVAVQPGLADVVGDSGVNKFSERPASRGGLADGSGGNRMADGVENVEGSAAEHEVSAGGLLFEGFGDVGGGAEFFGEGVSHVGQGVSRAAGDNEFAFAEKGFGLAPPGDVAEGVDSDEEEKLVDFLEGGAQPADGIDRVVGGRRSGRSACELSGGYGRFRRRLEQGGQERLLLLVGGGRGGHKEDARQAELLPCGVGQREMAAVNGVKRSAEEPDFHAVLWENGPASLAVSWSGCKFLLVGLRKLEEGRMLSPTVRPATPSRPSSTRIWPDAPLS